MVENKRFNAVCDACGKVHDVVYKYLSAYLCYDCLELICDLNEEDMNDYMFVQED